MYGLVIRYDEEDADYLISSPIRLSKRGSTESRGELVHFANVNPVEDPEVCSETISDDNGRWAFYTPGNSRTGFGEISRVWLLPYMLDVENCDVL